MSGYSMDKIVALCKNRGFVFAGAMPLAVWEILAGLAVLWLLYTIGMAFVQVLLKHMG